MPDFLDNIRILEVELTSQVVVNEIKLSLKTSLILAPVKERGKE